ncbi:hypothetical protein GLYMA_14G183400v4 [Glycine max]|nr:hypothetical protein GLYMA_14G183400v4 [Glycine max]
MASQAVQLRIEDNLVIMDNGILQVYLSNPGGLVTRIQYNGIDNLLEVLSGSEHRGYWDVVWSEAGSTGTAGTFERYVMLRNSSGFYSYAIFEHLAEWPAFNIPQIRIVYKLRKDNFHYMAVSDDRQRFMPLPDDRLPGRGKELVPPEAVLLVNQVEPEFKGEGYQFWTRANEKGYFSINNICGGDYNLYAWVPGFIGEYWNNIVLAITPGSFNYILLERRYNP